MADKQREVVLVHPDGREYSATTPSEVNDLVVGRGYRIKNSKLSLAEAADRLSENVDPSAETHAPNTVATTTPPGPTVKAAE